MPNLRPYPNSISIVIPCLNEAETIESLVERLRPALKDYPKYELLFVSDGSTDLTVNKLQVMRSLDRRIKYIALSRNFGHQSALRAGLASAMGEIVVTMDADLQHPPELIEQMILKWREGSDVVLSARQAAGSPSFKQLTSKLFYKIMRLLSDTRVDPGSADFRLLDRKVVDVLSQFQESAFFLRGLVSWLGFKQSTISYTPGERVAGRSNYSVRKMCSLAIDGILSFSIRPLRLSLFLGLIFSALAFMYAGYALYVKFALSQAIPGWTSVLVSILLLGGIQLMVLGIIGEYLGKLFIESLKRPPYIIAEQELGD